MNASGQSDSRHIDGRDAERRALEHLRKAGLELLHRNWTRRVGELDLVMRNPADATVVFVEVRYRSSSLQGGGFASIDYRKRARLRRAASAWLQTHGDENTRARIDVISVSPDHIDWIVSAIEDAD